MLEICQESIKQSFIAWSFDHCFVVASQINYLIRLVVPR